jgi:hypothetical protein
MQVHLLPARNRPSQLRGTQVVGRSQPNTRAEISVTGTLEVPSCEALDHQRHCQVNRLSHD